jgi:exodeoxyribonuclease VII small subunit
MPKKTRTFEESAEELERLVDALENGGLPLDEALDAVSVAAKAAAECAARLKAAESRVMTITRKLDGLFELTPFEGEDSL